jgi:hypothetical protein
MPTRCPHLPDPVETMDWRHMNALRDAPGGALFLTGLRYGQQLWQQNLPARALLAVDRALYADLKGDEPELAQHPLPYAAIAWMVANNPGDAFTGNARVHYQHLADRVRGEREAQKRWRAWAAWAVVRRVCPDLPADPKHAVEEPTEARIEAELMAHGIPGEVAMWRAALAAV